LQDRRYPVIETIRITLFTQAMETDMANAFVHIELNTTDLGKAKEFYGQMFEWDFQEADMGPSGTYIMIKPKAGTGGGMLKNPMPGVPSFWLAYVEVADVGAATQKAKSLGAKIVRDVTDLQATFCSQACRNGLPGRAFRAKCQASIARWRGCAPAIRWSRWCSS
jgi:predicted enzyme related to lactoylglutathione lyase